MGLNLSTFALDLAVETKAFVVDYVGKALAGISDRCAALEQQLIAVKATPGPAGERGEMGPPGRDGVDADPVRLKAEMTAEVRDQLRAEMVAMMREMVRAEVRDAMAGVRMPMDGRDGKDADLGMVKAFVEAAALAHRGQDGAPGANGRDGVDGKDGASVTLADVQPLIAAEVQRVVSMLPPAKDGQDGAPGPAGRDGIDGTHGQDGKDGRDGLPGVPGPQGEKGLDGRHGLDGKDGAPGLNGKDGTTFTGFGFVIDDEAGPIMSLKSTAGNLEAHFPGMWDAGVWRVGKSYPRGACVSWNGSTWIAQRNTTGEKPGDGSGAWRLAVKAGRDAKPPKEGS